MIIAQLLVLDTVGVDAREGEVLRKRSKLIPCISCLDSTNWRVDSRPAYLEVHPGVSYLSKLFLSCRAVFILYPVATGATYVGHCAAATTVHADWVCTVKIRCLGPRPCKDYRNLAAPG